MINADYLKRYLPKGETKKRKKVRPQKTCVIDDDVDLKQIALANHENNSEDDDDNPVKILEYLENEKANATAFTTSNWINCDETADIKIEAPDPNGEPFIYEETIVKEEPLSPCHSETNSNNIKGHEHNQKSTRARERHDSGDEDVSPARKLTRYDSDPSPPRRSDHNNLKAFLPRKHRQCDSDESPPRRSRIQKSGRGPTADVSPPRRTAETSRPKIKSEPLSPRNEGYHSACNGDNSPLRKPSITNSKPEVKVIMRERTGTKINLEEIRKKKEAEEAVKKAVHSKYEEWSKGLKQKEIRSQMEEDFEKESNKPLARYADDADLNEELRLTENKEDPMFEYMRKKRAKEAGNSGKARRTYQGSEPPPNRFNIRPGYRWDGVDRSNGFENKLFATKNSRKAEKDEFYKWSTEDM